MFKRFVIWPLRFLWQYRAVLSVALILRLLLHVWTTPISQSPGDILTATNYDTYTVNNLIYLFSGRPHTQVLFPGTATVSITSTSFVDVDATNWIGTMSTSSGRVRVEATFHYSMALNSGWLAFFDIIVDGTTRLGDPTNGLAKSVSATFGQCTTLVAYSSNLSVGSHTFKIQAKVAGGATLVVGVAGGSAIEENLIMNIWEY